MKHTSIRRGYSCSYCGLMSRTNESLYLRCIPFCSSSQELTPRRCDSSISISIWINAGKKSVRTSRDTNLHNIFCSSSVLGCKLVDSGLSGRWITGSFRVKLSPVITMSLSDLVGPSWPIAPRIFMSARANNITPNKTSDFCPSHHDRLVTKLVSTSSLKFYQFFTGATS